MCVIRLERRNLDLAEAVEYLLEIELTQEQRQRLLLWGGVHDRETQAAEREACAGVLDNKVRGLRKLQEAVAPYVGAISQQPLIEILEILSAAIRARGEEGE